MTTKITDQISLWANFIKKCQFDIYQELNKIQSGPILQIGAIKNEFKRSNPIFINAL